MQQAVPPLTCIAQNNMSSALQHILHQLEFDADVCVVQVNPSGDVMTLLAVPDPATAQNSLSSLLQHTDCH